MVNKPNSLSRQKLTNLLDSQIVILDGAMGTMIQAHDLQENDYRGQRFADWSIDLKGNNDLLSITQPRIIEEIHKEFVDSNFKKTLQRLYKKIFETNYIRFYFFCCGCR